jgi:hypothetical protein
MSVVELISNIPGRLGGCDVAKAGATSKHSRAFFERGRSNRGQYLNSSEP